MIQLWIARSARETLWNGSADPANCPRATRTRELRAKKKMLVPLNPQYKTTTPSTNTRKIVSTTRKTTTKTLCSTMPNKMRKKIHRGTKANFRRRNCRRVQTTNIRMTTQPVPKTSKELATAREYLAVIPAPEEGPRNG